MNRLIMMAGLLSTVMLCSIMAEGQEDTVGGSGGDPNPDVPEDAEGNVESDSQNPNQVGNPTAPEPGAEGSGLSATESLDGHNEARTTGGHPGTTEPEPPTDEEGDEASQRAADARESEDEPDDGEADDGPDAA